MRIESSVTSITWIPSEAIKGMPKLPFEWGVAHYDEPPPDRLIDLDAMHENDLFREANELKAWIEVDDDGTISDCGYSGGGRIGVTRMKLGRREIAFPAVQYPLIQAEPEVRRRRGALRPVGRRPHGPARAAPRERQAVHAHPVVIRVDDARARRSRPTARPRARWSARARSRATGSTTPTACSSEKSGVDRLRALVPRVARRAHAVGRRGLAGDRDRGRVGARARAVGLDHAQTARSSSAASWTPASA